MLVVERRRKRRRSVNKGRGQDDHDDGMVSDEDKKVKGVKKKEYGRCNDMRRAGGGEEAVHRWVCVPETE